MRGHNEVTDHRPLDELGYYLMAGAGGAGPANLVQEARSGEDLGLGTAFIGERWNVKEAHCVVGAACAVTSRMRIATAGFNLHTRHPMVTGSFAMTMQRMSGGRFTLGIARGIPAYSAFGIPPTTLATMQDWAVVMRRLFRGEVILSHAGPIGSYPVLFLDPDFDDDIRLAIAALGPKTLALGGKLFDDVILHTFFASGDPAAVRDDRQRRRRAGWPQPRRRPVWSCLATVADYIPEQQRLKKTVARLATYLQAYGDLMVDINKWDPAVLARFRADDTVNAIAGGIDDKGTPEQIEHIATLIPGEWLEPAATGTAEQCAARIHAELDYGADAVILHGATPDELAPIVQAYRLR